MKASICVLLFLYCFASGVRAQESPGAHAHSESGELTEGQQKLFEDMIEGSRKQCFELVEQIRNTAARDAAGQILKLIFTSEYCSCATQEIRSRFTPAILKEISSEEAGEELGRQAAGSCLVRLTLKKWTDICPMMIDAMRGESHGSNPQEKNIAGTCECGRMAVNDGLAVSNAVRPVKLLEFTSGAVRSCMLTNGIDPRVQQIAPARTPERQDVRESPTDPESTGIDPSVEAGTILRRFGIEGRWARDCENRGSAMTWIVYGIAPNGTATIEAYRGGASSPNLLTRDTLTSAHLLSEERIRLFSSQTFPGDIDRSTVVIKKTGSNIRFMESSFTTFGKVNIRIRNGVFTEILRETPLLTHCRD